MHEAGMTTTEMAEFLGHNPGAIWKALKRRGWWARPPRATREAIYHNGVRYAVEADSGYYRASNGRGHKGGAYLHVVLDVERHGLLPEGHEVHHRNEIKTDNSEDNLERMPKLGHSHYHNPKGIRRGNAVASTE